MGSFTLSIPLVQSWVLLCRFFVDPEMGVSTTMIFAAMINLFICFWVYFLHRQMIPWQEELAAASPMIEEKKGSFERAEDERQRARARSARRGR